MPIFETADELKTADDLRLAFYSQTIEVLHTWQSVKGLLTV
jgi:hypothetical protein